MYFARKTDRLAKAKIVSKLSLKKTHMYILLSYNKEQSSNIGAE